MLYVAILISAVRLLALQADGGGDGFLTLQEMLNHPHAFYQTVEDHEQEPAHDQF